jgi:hypothetical protein
MMCMDSNFSALRTTLDSTWSAAQTNHFLSSYKLKPSCLADCNCIIILGPIDSCMILLCNNPIHYAIIYVILGPIDSCMILLCNNPIHYAIIYVILGPIDSSERNAQYPAERGRWLSFLIRLQNLLELRFRYRHLLRMEKSEFKSNFTSIHSLMQLLHVLWTSFDA